MMTVQLYFGKSRFLPEPFLEIVLLIIEGGEHCKPSHFIHLEGFPGPPPGSQSSRIPRASERSIIPAACLLSLWWVCVAG